MLERIRLNILRLLRAFDLHKKIAFPLTVIIIAFVLLFVNTNAYSATIATAQAGNYSVGATWVGGVKPQVGDTAQFDHAVTLDENIAVDAIDNNSTVTFGGNYSVTITGGGDIDNDTGIINVANNNVTFKSSNTTKWTWDITTGTFTIGTGTHTFEYGNISIGASNLIWTTGTFAFTENCDFSASAVKYLKFDVNTTVTFTAAKTFTLSGGIFIISTGTFTASGSSGNEITFDGSNNTGYFWFQANPSLTLQYCNFDANSTMTLAALNGNNVTWENNNFYNSTDKIILSGVCSNTITFTDSNFYANDYAMALVHSAGAVDFVGCSGYSNTIFGFHHSGAGTVTYTRTKVYSNTLQNIYTTQPFTLVNSLLYESGYDNIYNNSASTGTITNCTIADANANYSNILTNQASGETLDIKNTISYGAKYGINSSGADDPTVTYSNAYGATTANYNGMTDPTESNGNISKNPKFVNAAGDDYSLTTKSFCIAAGTNTGAPATDIDGNTRPMPIASNVDMGAYEEQTIATTPTNPQAIITNMM